MTKILLLFQSFVSDTQKVRSAIGGSLYAFEIPSPQTLDLEIDQPCPEETVKKIEPSEPYIANSHETRKTCVRNMNAVYKDSPGRGDTNAYDGIDKNGESDISMEQKTSGIHNGEIILDLLITFLLNTHY